MNCVQCGAPESVVQASWTMSQGTNTGWFCDGCAQALCRRYPQTLFTFAERQHAS